MDVKYLSDDKGKITGVFIPLEDWERLQKQYNISLAEPAASNAQLQQGLAAAMAKAKPDPSDQA